jgi:valyl-tRNA synthetase
MENIQDWCISRQIWWGHRLPVYYCSNCAEGSRLEAEGKTPRALSLEPRAAGIIVSKSRPAKCPTCGNADLKQDDDVLDTWFSSWLWPFSTLGWPKQTKDLDYFYPTNTLVTAQEIIFFWVARMIMAGYFCMKRPPFTDVYIHGTVRDITGKKMSKSLGNIIDPLDIIKQYGTDALRYTLVTATAIGQDVFVSEDRFAAGRNFANKLWNATRFVLSTAEGSRLKAGGKVPRASSLEPRALSIADRWILSRLQGTTTKATAALEKYLFNEAATTLYDFLWHDFCDWYLEISKIKDQTSKGVLAHVLEIALRLLHPVMPFVTEELWQRLPKAGGAPASIMTAPWPKADKQLVDAEAEKLFERFQGVVTAIRNTRAELNVPLDSRPPIRLVSAKPDVRSFFKAHQALLQAMASLGEVRIEATRGRVGHTTSLLGAIAAGRHQLGAGTAVIVVGDVVVQMTLTGFIIVVQERQRMQQRVDELTKQLAGIEGRLKDDQFTAKAPKEVVEQTKERRAQVQESLKKFSDHLTLLQSM